MQLFPDGHSAFSDYRIGGTSLASPLFAGRWSLAVQEARSFDFDGPLTIHVRTGYDDVTGAGRLRLVYTKK